MEAMDIRNLKINTKGKIMHIRRRKGTQNPSPMPPDPKGKGKMGEMHVLSQRIPYRICMHAKENISNVSNTSAKQPWISHP
jgi:hypothetical protein